MTDEIAAVEEVVDAMARVLAIDLTVDSRPVVIAHLKIARDMASFVEEFDLPDEAEPAPVFTP
jgi:hypothetical protein